MSKTSEFWVRLANIAGSQRPPTGWPVISKEAEKVLYVPYGSGVHFTWSSAVNATLLTNYPDSSSNTLTAISEYAPIFFCFSRYLFSDSPP